jgi:tetratricopeptide (TPR) repeat protein
MDLYFQGKALLNKGWAPEYLAQARGLFERALALDPQNVEAIVWKMVTDLLLGSNLMSDNPAALIATIEATTARVLALAPTHAFAHLISGHVLILTDRIAQGMAQCERALTLDRNLAEAHAEIGFAKYLMGRAAETETHVNEAFRLSPLDIFVHRWFNMVGFAKLQLNSDAEAVGWLLRSIEVNRNWPITHFGLAAAFGLLGSLDQATAAAKAGLALNPSFTIRRYRKFADSSNPTYLAGRERVYQGMRLAGVPEG